MTQGSSLSKRAFQEDVARIAPTEVVLPFALSSQDQESHPILEALRRLDKPPVISFPHGAANHSQSAVEADANAAFNAIPLLSSYINETLLEQRPDLTHPLRVSPANNMLVDRITLRALEVKQNNDGGVSGTLLSVMDRCVTSAGKRLLADRLTSPSKSISEINARLSLVDYFKHRRRLSDDLVLYLKQLDDEARLLQKMSIGRPTAEDLLMVAKAIRVQGQIKALLEKELKGHLESSMDDHVLAGIKRLVLELRNFDDIAERIETSVDAKALEAQRTRDFAAELAASQASTEDVEAAEEEGIDIWNIPLDVILGKRRKSHPIKAEDLVPEPPLAKNGTAPISWGKGETSVLQPG
jgi:DNA mismatch repair ATPase MutS